MNRYLETAIFVSFANYFERKQKGNIICFLIITKILLQ